MFFKKTMNFEFNIFSIVLLMIGTANLFLSLVLFKQNENISKWFSVLMFFISVWSIAYSFELASSNLDQMLFLIKIEYSGISFLPAIWIIFIIKFTHKNHWLSFSNLMLIFLFPLVDFILVVTNSYHFLHYKSVSIDNSGSFPLLAIQPGIAYHVHTVYFYFMLLWGVFLLVKPLTNVYFIYRNQYIYLTIAALIPWFVNIFYLIGYKPFGHIDLTPYAFIVTSFSIAYSLLKHSFLKLIPIAREKVIDSMSEGVIVLDSKKRIVDTNASIIKYLSNDDQKLIGKNILTVLENGLDFQTALDTIETKTVVINSHHRFFEVTINRLVLHNTSSKGFLLIFRDISESKIILDKLEKQALELETLNRLKDKLFSIIAHDLKSPFASLVSMLKILKDGDLTIEEFKEYLPKLTENVEYTSTMLENLLNWSRSQINSVNIVFEDLVLKEIIENEIKFFSKKAYEKNIIIQNELDENTIVKVDRNTVNLVFRNLFSNAIKFCNSGDTITISSKIFDGKLTVLFADTGIGMSEENVEKIFGTEIFTTYGTNKEKGTGLGLLLCKDFIEKNGGSICVESELGKGTTFYIQFAANN